MDLHLQKEEDQRQSFNASSQGEENVPKENKKTTSWANTRVKFHFQVQFGSNKILIQQSFESEKMCQKM